MPSTWQLRLQAHSKTDCTLVGRQVSQEGPQKPHPLEVTGRGFLCEEITHPCQGLSYTGLFSASLLRCLKQPLVWYLCIKKKHEARKKKRPCPLCGHTVLINDRTDSSPFLHDPGMVAVCPGQHSHTQALAPAHLPEKREGR